MALEQYASLFEIVSGVIVIVTLIFVVIQLRQNTLAINSATVLGTHNHTLGVYEVMTDDSMMEVLVKGMPRPEDLTPVEKGKFDAFWTMAMQNYQQTLYQINSGTYPAYLFDGWWQVLRDNFMSPGFQRYWRNRRHFLSDEFQRFVEDQVKSREPTAAYAQVLEERRARADG